jgi:hypothetical protein
MDREDQGISLGERLLGIGSGVSYPGNVAGGALSGGLETLTTLLTIDKLLKAGGGSQTGGFDDLRARIGFG